MTPHPEPDPKPIDTRRWRPSANQILRIVEKKSAFLRRATNEFRRKSAWRDKI
jgi:hypothetical protein